MDCNKVLGWILISIVFLCFAVLAHIWGYLLIETIFFTIALVWLIVCTIVFCVKLLRGRDI